MGLLFRKLVAVRHPRVASTTERRTAKAQRPAGQPNNKKWRPRKEGKKQKRKTVIIRLARLAGRQDARREKKRATTVRTDEAIIGREAAIVLVCAARRDCGPRSGCEVACVDGLRFLGAAFCVWSCSRFDLSYYFFCCLKKIGFVGARVMQQAPMQPMHLAVVLVCCATCVGRWASAVR